MLGDFVDAPEALNLGLINRVIKPEDLDAEAEKLIQRLSNAPTIALGNIKRQIYAAQHNTLQQQMDLEAELFAECTASEDWEEGVNAFVEKRRADYQGK